MEVTKKIYRTLDCKVDDIFEFIDWNLPGEMLNEI